MIKRTDCEALMGRVSGQHLKKWLAVKRKSSRVDLIGNGRSLTRVSSVTLRDMCTYIFMPPLLGV